jgi:polyhydroxyalkanoate synthase
MTANQVHLKPETRPDREAETGSRPAPNAPSDNVSNTAPNSGAISPDSFAQLNGEEFARNMLRVGIQAQHLLADFFKRLAEAGEHPGPLDPLNISGAFLALAKAMGEDRETVMAGQMQLWKSWMDLWELTARRMLGGEAPALVKPQPGDRRFKDEEWQRNEIFDFIKQSYLLAANALQQMVANLHSIPEQERKRVAFYTKQFADAFAPTNFPLTNPEVMRETLRSNGENLVKGLNNLLADIERGKGELSIRQSTDNFVLGENIATTPGKVVFRNELMELLQYVPATDEVYRRPLLIFPPWINKYYILDLRPQNSFIRWLVSRGYTVFVVSWVNPDQRLAEFGFEDYMRDGIFAALDAVKDATGVEDPNCVGYCIGGTLLAATMAFMAAGNEPQFPLTRIHSATFWAAQTDFSESGDLSVFVDEAQLEALEEQMKAAGGVLQGSKMATAFNMLRANDLIWSFVINNYLLGRQPMPFDLLYWNSDTTRMPEKLHLSYLRQCYRDNALALGKMMLGGIKLDLSKVTVPAYLQSAREDHIAPANSVFKATRLFGGPVRFIIAGSGHIAGVINPPEAKKYQYWTNESAEMPATVEAWRAGSTEHPGSWWPDWDQWLSKLSGEKISARQPGDGKLPVLGDAPGTYVKIKAS